MLDRLTLHIPGKGRAYLLSLDTVKEGYMTGHVTKEEYANTLREYQQSNEEMKSKARDDAIAHH